MANKPRNMREIPITVENYARVESYARAIIARGGTLPPDMIAWGQQAQSAFESMPARDQQYALHQLEQQRAQVEYNQFVTEQAVGRAEAGQWVKDHSRGLGANGEGVSLSKLKEIADNKKDVKVTRQAVKNAAGVNVTDQYTKKTKYETKRTESQKYTDDQSRRASLVLAFGEADAQRASEGKDTYTNMDSDIDPSYLNSPNDRQSDVANAMLEVESRSAAGHELPASG
jgi:hypothetical protein